MKKKSGRRGREIKLAKLDGCCKESGVRSAYGTGQRVEDEDVFPLITFAILWRAE